MSTTSLGHELLEFPALEEGERDGQRARNFSSIKSFRRCPQQYHYKYIQGLDSRPTKMAAERGTAIHECLEAYYGCEEPSGRVQAVRDVLTKRDKWWAKLKREDKERYTRWVKKKVSMPEDVKLLMRAYLSWVKVDGRDDDWEVVMVEGTFERMHEGMLFKGTLDSIWHRKSDNTYWLGEYKTGRAGDTTYAHKGVDPQTTFYFHNAEVLLDIELAGVMFHSFPANPGAKPSLTKAGKLSLKKMHCDPFVFDDTMKTLRKENPNLDKEVIREYREKVVAKKSHLFDRTKVTKIDAVQENILADIKRSIKQMERLESGKTQPVRNLTPDCDIMCDYRELCILEVCGLDITDVRKEYKTRGKS